MKKSIKWTAAALSVLSLTGIVACGEKNDNNVSLTVWVAEGDAEFMKWAQEEFKKANPDKQYTFNVAYEGENDIATKILNDVERAADVFSFPNDQISKLVNGDALSRLGGTMLTELKNSIDEKAMESATIQTSTGEETYGIPYTDNTFFLYYNKSVLSAEDVKTIDGILAKCTSNKQFAMPLNDGWYTTSFYFGKNLGYEVTYDKNLGETSIRCDFDNATGEQVTESIWRLAQQKGMKGDANDSKITAGFADGSIVAATSGIWNRSSIEKSLGDNFAVAKLPSYTFGREGAEEQTQLVSFAGYKLIGVNNYSKEKSEAMKFASFYANKQSQLKHFELRGFVPTDKTARTDERITSDVCAKAITEQLQYSKAQKNVPSTLWVPMEGLGNSMLTAVSSGKFDVATQLKACVDAIRK